jgi:hypothetical protein
MCLGGTNHCMVGWWGSQFPYCRLIIVNASSHLLSILCRLVVFFMFASYLMSGSNVDSDVFISFVHARTHL